jgi:hypothetical protein
MDWEESDSAPSVVASESEVGGRLLLPDGDGKPPPPPRENSATPTIRTEMGLWKWGGDERAELAGHEEVVVGGRV